MRTIYLIGFMGSGKSTIGVKLSEALQMSFIDTDTYIEQKCQQKISDIFSKEGEETFRDCETTALKENSQCIIATGGGIVEKKENISIMKKKGIIIYLKTTFDEIVNRLENDQTRPLWKQDISKRRALFNKRYEIYEKCSDFIVETDRKSISSIVEEIINYLKV